MATGWQKAGMSEQAVEKSVAEEAAAPGLGVQSLPVTVVPAQARVVASLRDAPQVTSLYLFRGLAQGLVADE